MKAYAVVLLCLVATSAAAQQFQFRGDFVETHLAKEGFLDTIPRGTRLNCEQRLCSGLKAVRIYVFRNKEQTREFWSTDYSDVMFDEPETVSACGRSGHIAYYDETNQLLSRDQLCGKEDTDPPMPKRGNMQDALSMHISH